MKFKFTLITALMATGSFSFAGDRSIGDGTLPEFLQQFDTNEDGQIDEEERQAVRDLRAKMREERRNSIDTDGDGQIGPEEIEAAREELRSKIEERRLTKFNEIAGEDDLISKEEYATIPGIDRLPDFIFDAIFDRLDRDDSGDISSEEFFQRLRDHNERPDDEGPDAGEDESPEEG
jgi:Ca2+-binding EF-hand superfamily protein